MYLFEYEYKEVLEYSSTYVLLLASSARVFGPHPDRLLRVLKYSSYVVVTST
jgi:hypothetical protein